MILLILFAQLSSSGQTNVNLDDEGLKDELPKSVQKVELDLDDALFLEFEDNAPKPPAKAPASSIGSEISLATTPVAQAPFWKTMWFLGLMVILFLGVSGAAFFVFTAPQSPPPIDWAMDDETPVSSNTPYPERQFSLKPFVVELKQGEKIRLLTYAFAIPYSNNTFHKELKEKIIPLRDAVYQYLVSSDLVLPDNPESVEKVKSATITRINQIMDTGQISSLYIAEYGVH